MPTRNSIEKQGLTSGSVLHEEKPFIHVLSPEFKETHCDHCFSNKDLLKCSGCGYARYCDIACQKAQWIDHKGECSRIRKLPPGRELPSAARLIAKIILKLKRGGDTEKGYYGKNKFRMFKDLMSHYPEMKSDQKRIEHAMSLWGVLNSFLGPNNLPNYPEFVGIYGRMVVNGFSILDGEMTTLGTGIYLGASTIDHSCTPNAFAVFSGTTLQIRALNDIPQYDWSKVRISYVDSLSCKEERKDGLRSTYYFDCDCERCSDEESIETAAVCPQCRGLVFINQMRCSNCSWSAPETFKSKYNDVVELTMHQHKEMKTVAYFDACKLCYEKEKEVLHPSNLLHTKTLDLAFEAAIQMKSWVEAVKLGKELIPGYRMYYGDYHPLTGLLLLKIGKILLYMEKNEDALEMLMNSEKVLRRSHGTRHVIYRQSLEPLLIEAKSVFSSE